MQDALGFCLRPFEDVQQGEAHKLNVAELGTHQQGQELGVSLRYNFLLKD